MWRSASRLLIVASLLVGFSFFSAQSTTYAQDVSADLSVTKTDSADPVLVSDAFTYTITVANAGPNDATGVKLTDTLPTGLTFISMTPEQGTCINAVGVITCDIGTIPAGEDVVVSVVVITSAAGTLSNTAAVTSDTVDPDAANNTDTETTTVAAASADLSVTKTDSADPVLVGDTFTYTITIANAGPNDATGVKLSDTLPASVTFIAMTPEQGTCIIAAGAITCDIGTIPADGDVVVSVVVTTTAAGTLSNTAAVTSDTADPDAANNTDTETTTVGTASADLSVTKTASTEHGAMIDQPLTYTITVTNSGPQAAVDAVLVDALPASATFVSMTTEQGTCVVAASAITCELGDLANGDSVAVVIVVTPTEEGDLLNIASVTSGTEDPEESNNVAEVTVTVGRNIVRPGNGYGDKNHIHTGPPGQNKRDDGPAVAPGNSGNAPGHGGDNPGNGNANGHQGDSQPGNSGNTPGHGDDKPGNGNHGDGNQGNSGNAPGHSDDHGGNGNGHGKH